MVLGLVVPVPAQEVRPVFGLVARVLAHVMPGYISFLRRLLIVIARLSEEGEKEPPVIFAGIEGQRIVWGVKSDIWPVVRDHQQALFRVEGVYRRRMVLCDRYLTSPGCYTFGDCYMIVLFPMNSSIL